MDNKEEYMEKAKELAMHFKENFKKFKNGSQFAEKGGPQI